MEYDKLCNIDIFISYASEDADAIARPLAAQLTCRGCRVWFDEYAISLGDSLRQKITDGLRTCKFGVIILSPDFFNKKWTKYELDGLTTREIAEGKKIILPIWHNVTFAEVAKYSPVLADRKAVPTSDGLSQVAKNIIKELSSYHLSPPDGIPLPVLLQTYISLWLEESKLLNAASLDLFFINKSNLKLSTDAYKLFVESAFEVDDTARWLKTVPLEIVWSTIKKIVSQNNSYKPKKSKIAVAKLLCHDYFISQYDYDNIVSTFLLQLSDKSTINVAIANIYKRLSLGDEIANYILNKCHSRSIPSKEIMQFMCDVCERSKLIDIIHFYFADTFYINDETITALNILGDLNLYESIPLLKQLLRGGCGGNDGLCEWYIQCIEGNLLKLGVTNEEIIECAGHLEYYLNTTSAMLREMKNKEKNKETKRDK